MNKHIIKKSLTLFGVFCLLTSYQVQANQTLIKRMKASDKLAPACKKLGGQWKEKYRVCVGVKKPQIGGLCVDPNVRYAITPVCPEGVMDYMSVAEFNNKYGSKKTNEKSKTFDSDKNPANSNNKLAQRCRSMGGAYCKETRTCTVNNNNLSAGCMWVIKNGQLTQACTADNTQPPIADTPSSAGTPPFLGKEMDYLLQVEGTAYCERGVSKKGKKLKWRCNGPGSDTFLADGEDVISEAKQSGCKYPVLANGAAWLNPESKYFGRFGAEGWFFYCGAPMQSYSRDIKKYMKVPKSFLKHRKIYGCPSSKWKVPKKSRKYYYDKSTCIHIEHLNNGDVSWKTKKIKKKI